MADQEVADWNEIYEDVEMSVKKNIEATLRDTQWNPRNVNAWCNAVVNGCLKDLQEIAKPFKFVVTCIIMQKNGAGMHTSATCHWDTEKDGYCKVPWENSTMHCICTIYGMGIMPAPQDLDF